MHNMGCTEVARVCQCSVDDGEQRVAQDMCRVSCCIVMHYCMSATNCTSGSPKLMHGCLQGQQVTTNSGLFSAERRFTKGGSMQSSLQETQGNSLGNSTQFAGSSMQDPQNIASP